MKSLLVILIIFLAAILQSSFLSFLTVFGVMPNLVLIIILFLVVLKSFRKIWPTIILAGLFLDLFSNWPFGLISLSLISTAYLVDWLKKDVFGQINSWLFIGLVALATLVYNLLIMILGKLLVFDLNIEWVYNLIYLIPLEILANIVLALLIYYGFKKIPGQKQFG